MQHPTLHDAAPSAAHALRAALAAQLESAENVLASFEVDLDAELRFAPGLLVLSDRRVLAADASGHWQSWPLVAGLSAHHLDHAGIGTIELHDATRRLASWRFTLGLNPQALQWIGAFERQVLALRSGRAAAADESEACPTCGATLPPDSDECPACARVQPPPPSTWVLLRLWRFARPYRFQLLIGFLLTLASTGATLVPPYLTIPLMDDVLIPFQNGEQIAPGLVFKLLGGLLASGLLAWGLGWARTFSLAIVSERIGADLRTTTYEQIGRAHV